MTIHRVPTWINEFNREKIQDNRFNETARNPNRVILPEVKGIIDGNYLPGLKGIATEHKIPVRVVKANDMTLSLYSNLLKGLGIKGGLINNRLEQAIQDGHGDKVVYPGYLAATTTAFANMRALQSQTNTSLHDNLSKLASNEIFIRGRNSFAPATRDHEGFDNTSVSGNIDLLLLRHKRLQETSAECLVKLAYIQEGDNVLDVGCGLGEFSKKINEYGISTVSIEPFNPPEQTPREAILSGIIRNDLATHLNQTNAKYSVVYVGNLYPLNDQMEKMTPKSLENFISDVHRATQIDGKAIIGIASLDGKYIIGNKPNNLRALLLERFDKVTYISAKNIDSTIFEKDGAIGGQIGFFIGESPK